MNSVYNGNLILSLFGESHGSTIGIVIDGFPPGIEINMDSINQEMRRRKPGNSKLSTPRSESDSVKIVSGVFNGVTTGAPICGLIETEDTRSKNYDNIKDNMRPGHSDYPGYIHYRGKNDYRGGGHFSGRLTAPIVFAGALCKEFLKPYNIDFGCQLINIGPINNLEYEDLEITEENLSTLRSLTLPVLNEDLRLEMEEYILQCKAEGDSIGGSVDFIMENVPAGLGNPFFNSLESTLSRLFFSIPALKSVSFGEGANLGINKGSWGNDPYGINEQGEVFLKDNKNGGILGGISNGNTIRVNLAIKSTPSISKVQKTVNIKEKKEVDLVIEGRHDPCIVPRAIPVVEAMGAIGIMDCILENKKWD